MTSTDRSEATPGASAGARVRWLEDLVEGDRLRFGAKSVNLALMARWGLPVPRGFAFRGDRARTLGAEERRAIREAYADLARRCGQENVAVAVRSSAVGEDGEERSYAGQYESRLNVAGADELVRAVEECLAAADSERVRSYREAAAVQPSDMAVLVQPMVRADFAGVCFTHSPLSGEEVVIEVVAGLGESLVSGSRSPARACLARQDLALRSSEDSEEILSRLGHATLQRVAALALAAEDGFGFPVDVEWALAGGEVWLLQSRPISAADSAVDLEAIRREEIARLGGMAERTRTILAWSDFSLADMVPRPSTLTLELFDLLADRGGSFDRAMRALGLRYAGPERVGRMFEVICGRAYLNLAAALQSLDVALPLALDAGGLPKSGESSVDVEHIPARWAWRGWRSARELPLAWLRWLLVVPIRFLRLRRRFDREFLATVKPAVIHEAAALRGRDLRLLDGRELVAAFRAHVRRFVDMGYYHQVADSVAIPTHFLLQRVLRRLYGDRADEVEGKLATGLAGNFNTETNLELARVAAGEVAMEDFLALYGHRGSPDYEISAPRWRENPQRVEAMAQMIARAGVDPARQFEEQKRVRARTEATFAADLRSDPWLRPWRYIILRELSYYQRYCPLRESTQALCFLFVELARSVLLEVARRASAGDLVFFFTLDELERVVRAGPSGRDLDLARERRRRLRAARRIHVPHLVRSDDLEAIGGAPPLAADARELRGQSVSPGVARGRARVVYALDEARDLEPGEILVTASADPSWTPLFLIAAGVVLEQGGVLSHPAIVAREYGVPALTNVSQVTRLVRTGQPLVVDADRGRVVLED